MEHKKRLSSKEKMMILRELLDNRVQIGELSEKYGVHPNVIYNWKKILFERGEILFEEKREKTTNKTDEKISRLESKLKDRNDLISEILEDNIRLKKSLNGDD